MSSGSVIHPFSTGNAITEKHREVEEAFSASSDLRVVPVGPLVLATNALGWSYPIKAGSVLPLYRPDAVTAPIHERDRPRRRLHLKRGSTERGQRGSDSFPGGVNPASDSIQLDRGDRC